MNYIKGDIISHMYLESYTKITKSCFSFTMHLRIKPSVSMATTEGQALIFSHLAYCKSFMTRLPSVSSSLKLPCLCYQISLSKQLSSFVTYLSFVQCKPIVRHSIFTISWHPMYLLGTLFYTVMWVPNCPHVVSCLRHKVFNATEDRDPIMC